MLTISPRFTEYGRLSDMNNGWIVVISVGLLTIPNPVISLFVNAVIRQVVTVSGICRFNLVIDSLLKKKKIQLKVFQLFENALDYTHIK